MEHNIYFVSVRYSFIEGQKQQQYCPWLSGEEVGQKGRRGWGGTETVKCLIEGVPIDPNFGIYEF